MTQLSVNKLCPNSGKPVVEDSIGVYEGVKIGFCNPGCRDSFQENPEGHPHILGTYFPNGRLNVYDPKEFVSERAWGKKYIANMGEIGIRLHYTDEPYVWHENDGQEVFVVLDGTVEMRYERQGAAYKSVLLTQGMFAHMEEGCRHVAYPQGAARILVIERLGSL
ncbi:hypothetical protein [Terasakiella pusilla]|uniref:hypothetical protein n=1 Tax=Terasakiella pusilla TaxID=64973 RepID=UPI003AA9846A